MATVDEVVDDLLGSLGTDVGFLLGVRWINDRYQQLVSRSRFNHLRQLGEIQVPAIIDDGAVTTTRDSTTVTPDSDATTAWNVSPGDSTSHEYWYLQVSAAWYKVSSIGSSGTTMTLATAFSEDDQTDKSYSLVKRFHPLNSSARWISSVLMSRLRFELAMKTPDQFNIENPGRPVVGSYPTRWVNSGTDTSNNVKIELWPYAQNSEILHYVYWDLPGSLAIGATIPPQIDPYILKEGALIDLYRYQAADAIRRGDYEGAAINRNESRAQTTAWRKIMQEASRTDRAVDDVTFILTELGLDGHRRRSDIITARDVVANRWNFT